MKHRTKNALLLIALMTGSGFLLNHGLIAQTLTTLHSFTPSDGIGPYAGLLLTGDRLYGTTYSGGASNQGTVFSVSTDGTGFTNLHSFTGQSGGNNPLAGLIFSDNTLYGTTYGAGWKNGTVFKVNTDGAGFTNLVSFGAVFDGANAPSGGLILSGSMLYGTTRLAGSSGNGTVFAVQTDGTGFTNLHSFTSLSYGTNSDGISPEGALMLSSNTFYGMASRGGSFG